MSSWLEREDGTSIRVRDRGLLLGRAPDCDVILPDPSASRTHAWLRNTVNGLQLTVLGRHPTRVEGETVRGTVSLGDGASLELPGMRFTVRCPLAPRPPAFAVQLGDDLLVRVGRDDLRLGGGHTDHVRLPGKAPRLIVFRTTAQSLYVELSRPGLVSGVKVHPGDITRVHREGEVEVDGLRLTVHSEAHAHSTIDETLAGATLPTEVRFDFLPVGARLSLQFSQDVAIVDLSEMRARLVAALLQPPGDYEAGSFVPDEVLLPMIWPGDRSKGRLDLNTLVHRTRRTLVKRGIDPHGLLERMASGGATRFRLSPGARIEMN